MPSIGDNYNRIVGNNTVGNGFVGNLDLVAEQTMEKRLKQAYGNVVTGDRFWDRKVEMALFIERIDAGAHQLVVAQRRMGKTSLMAEAARRLRNRYYCIFVDLQGARSEGDAVAELSVAIHRHKPLWQKTKEVFGNIMNAVTERVEKVGGRELGVTLRAGLTRGNWIEKGDQIFGILASAERPVLLLFDEVPIMINHMLERDAMKITDSSRNRVEAFLCWLRKNSIRHQGKLRMVVSGSIGLEPVLRQAGLSATIINYMPFELKPWDDDTAAECIEALANEYGVELDERVAREMVARVGYAIPHHIQMFFDKVYLWCKRKGSMTFSVEEIEEVYKREMLGARGHAELSHYEERLKSIHGEWALAIAVEMLTEAAVTGYLSGETIRAIQKDYELEQQGVAKAQDEMLWALEHDGYLRREAKGYVFVSRLLRDWWKAHHGLAFVPFMKRGR